MTIDDAIKYVDNNFKNMSPQDCKDFIQKVKNEPWIREFFDITIQGRTVAQYSAYVNK